MGGVVFYLAAAFDLASARNLLARGGPVMWPLLTLSVLATTLLLERGWFFLRVNGPGGTRRWADAAAGLRAGRGPAKRRGFYGRAAGWMAGGGASSGASITGAAALPPGEVIEFLRPRIERFLPTLSTVITAAPMLGIIDSFAGLGGAGSPADPATVGAGIGEALLSTAAGLVVALVTLLPYNLLRVQAERTLTRLEVLAEAAGTR